MAALEVIRSNSTSCCIFDFCSRALIVVLNVIVFVPALLCASIPKSSMPWESMAALQVIMPSSTSYWIFEICSHALIVALNVIVFVPPLLCAGIPKGYMPWAFIAVLKVIMSNSTSCWIFDFCSHALIVAPNAIVFAPSPLCASIPKRYMPWASMALLKVIMSNSTS